jgi:DNA repair protein RadC
VAARGARSRRPRARAGLGPNMITLEDCIGLCGLTEEEVLAIAEHEHLPEVAATALAQYLLSHEHGSEKVRDMIIDDFRQAQRSGDKKHVLTLLHVLHHFLKTHPEATPSNHPWSGRL